MIAAPMFSNQHSSLLPSHIHTSLGTSLSPTSATWLWPEFQGVQYDHADTALGSQSENGPYSEAGREACSGSFDIKRKKG